MAGLSDVRLVDEWRGRLALYAMSELTVAEFCIVEGVSVSCSICGERSSRRSPNMARTRRLVGLFLLRFDSVTSPNVPVPLVTVQPRVGRGWKSQCPIARHSSGRSRF